MTHAADAGEPVAIRQAPAGATFRGGTTRAGDYGPLAGGADGPYDWAHHTGAAIRSSPVVVGGLVYVGSFGGLHAVDAATGIPRWVHPTGGEVDASPAVSGGMVFVTSTDGVICALSADDGELQWAWDSGALASSSPAVVGDCVVIGGPASTVLALDAWSGDLRWTCRTHGGQTADPIGSRLLSPMDTSPAIIDGVVYINDRQLLALDLATGTMRWAAPVSTTATTSPAVAGGVVYTAELGGAICAVDAVTGDIRWRSAARDVFFAFSTVAVVDDTVIACGQGSASGEQTGSDLDGGVVLALDATTGALRWRSQTSDPVLCSPAVCRDVVFVTETGADVHLLAYAIDSGELQQRRKLGTAGSGQIVTSSPAIAGGTLYVGLPDGRLIARPAASSGRSGGGRRLTAWWGPNRERRAPVQRSSDYLPAVREADDDSESTAPPSARMSARRRAELQHLADHYATAAQAASERDEFDEAVGWSTRAVEVVEALCEAFPDAAEHKAVLAGQLYNRATMLDRAGDAERGAQDAARALELYRERVPSDPGTYAPLALDAQSRLALLLAASEQNAQAREVGAAAVDEHRALAERYPGHEPGLARTLARYSEAMVRTGDQQRALAAGREVLELYRRRVGALGLDETLAFGRTAYNVATLLLPPTAQTAAEGWRAAADAFEQLTIVAQAGMGDAVEGARMLAEAFRATMDTG